jgi:hypothetical protein
MLIVANNIQHFSIKKTIFIQDIFFSISLLSELRLFLHILKHFMQSVWHACVEHLIKLLVVHLKIHVFTPFYRGYVNLGGDCGGCGKKKAQEKEEKKALLNIVLNKHV